MHQMTNAEFKKHRLELGLSQGELGKAIGVTERQIYNLEHISGKHAVKKPLGLLMRLLVEVSPETRKKVGFND